MLPSPRGDKMFRLRRYSFTSINLLPSPRGDKVRPRALHGGHYFYPLPSPRGDKMLRYHEAPTAKNCRGRNAHGYVHKDLPALRGKTHLAAAGRVRRSAELFCRMQRLWIGSRASQNREKCREGLEQECIGEAWQWHIQKQTKSVDHCCTQIRMAIA